MCPGAGNNGCKDGNPAALGRIYCASCQEKVSANGPAVIRSHQRAAERATNITVTTPHFSSLTALGKQTILQLLPPLSSRKLYSSNIVGVDTASTSRSVGVEDLYEVGAFFVDDNGDVNEFWANRHQTSPDYLQSLWNVWINNTLVETRDIIAMLSSLLHFFGNRMPIFYTGNNACDYKRLTGAYSETLVNPFPPEDQWFNLGKDVVQHIIGPTAPVIDTYWKLSIVHPHLYSAGDISIVAGPNVVDIPDCRNVLQDSRRVWNVHQTFRNILG
jgi:hypothetical protein